MFFEGRYPLRTNILSAINYLARLATASDLPPVLVRSHRPDFPAQSFTADIETGGGGAQQKGSERPQKL